MKSVPDQRPLRWARVALALLALVLAALVGGTSVAADTVVSNIATITFGDGHAKYTTQSNLATVTVTGTQGYIIKGHVRDQSGAPVKGARVDASANSKAVATATTDLAGAYTLSGLAAGTYDLLITATGRPTQVISGISLTSGSSTATIDLRAPTVEPWQVGLHMVAIPFRFADPNARAVLGTTAVKLARWIPDSGGRYVFYGSDPSFPGLVPGLGYWMDVDASTIQLAVAGTAVTETASFAIPLKPGWNMVGNPFCGDVEWGAAQVRCNGQTVSLETASKNKWVRPYAWLYDTAARQYVLLDAIYPGAQRLLRVWQACWVRAFTACDLLVAPPGTSAATADAVARSAAPTPEWKMQLIARTGDLCDSFNYMGVDGAADGSDTRANLQTPPALSRYLDLSFSDGRAAAADLATAYKPAVAGRVAWDFVVRSDVANAQIVIMWPDLSDVPAQYRLTLIDSDAQRRQYMRTTSSYVFNSGAQGGERHFQIEVDPSPWARLQVNNIMQIAGRASGMTISYDLSSQASVDVEVRSLAGQTVKVIARGAGAAAGTNLFTWDGTDMSGRMMPSGPYLCSISAVTEEGQAVKGMRTVILTR